MLRALITGFNGEGIGKLSKGNYFTKTFTYEIPEKIANVDVILKDLSIIAFLTEGTPSDAKSFEPVVITACQSSISIK